MAIARRPAVPAATSTANYGTGAPAVAGTAPASLPTPTAAPIGGANPGPVPQAASPSLFDRIMPIFGGGTSVTPSDSPVANAARGAGASVPGTPSTKNVTPAGAGAPVGAVRSRRGSRSGGGARGWLIPHSEVHDTGKALGEGGAAQVRRRVGGRVPLLRGTAAIVSSAGDNWAVARTRGGPEEVQAGGPPQAQVPHSAPPSYAPRLCVFDCALHLQCCRGDVARERILPPGLVVSAGNEVTGHIPPPTPGTPSPPPHINHWRLPRRTSRSSASTASCGHRPTYTWCSSTAAAGASTARSEKTSTAWL